MATKLLLALRDRGYEITVVTRQDQIELPAETQYQGIRIYRYPFPWTAFANGNLDELVEVRQKIKRLIRSVRRHVIRRRVRIVMWTKNAVDERASADVIKSQLEVVQDGDIILFHDEFPVICKALDELIPRWKESGYNFAKL